MKRRRSSFSWVHALPSPLGPVLFSGCYIDCLGSKLGRGILFKALWTQCYNVTTPWQLLSQPRTLGWRVIIINGQCQFLCGTEGNLPPLFFAAEESLSGKIEFPNKRGGCGWWWAWSGMVSGGRPGTSWQSLTEETNNSSLHFTHIHREVRTWMGLGSLCQSLKCKCFKFSQCKSLVYTLSIKSWIFNFSQLMAPKIQWTELKCWEVYKEVQSSL